MKGYLKLKKIRLWHYWISLITGPLAIALFMLSLTSLNRIVQPHTVCLNGVLYYKLSFSLAVAYGRDGKITQCEMKSNK